MSRLKSAGAARIVLAVTVILCIFLGARLGLGRVQNRALDVWYEGEDGDGASIRKWTEERASAAYNVTLLVESAGKPVEGLEETRSIVAKMKDSEDPGEIMELSRELTAPMEQLAAHMDSVLNEKDLKNARSQVEKFTARGDIIAHDGYHQLARSYNQKLERFPASVLGRLVGMKPLPQ